MGAPESEAELVKQPWFDTKKFPQASFQSTAIKAAGPGRLEVSGKLAIKGSTRDVVVPVTLMIIFLLLYLNFRRLTETLIVMLSVPFALVGGIWLMWLLGYNLSVAGAVGFIALAGVSAEFGVIMLLYLKHAWDERLAQGKASTEDLLDAIRETEVAALHEVYGGAAPADRRTTATASWPSPKSTTNGVPTGTSTSPSTMQPVRERLRIITS